MRIVWIDRKGTKANITNYVSSIEWKGSVNQATRELSFSLINSVFDKHFESLNIKLGDRVRFYDDGYLLSDVMIYDRSRNSEQGTVNYTGYDELKRFVKSIGSFKFKSTTPEGIARSLCDLLDVGCGDIIKTKVPIKKMIVDAESYYSIMLRAYTRAFKSNGNKYMPIMVGRKLSIIKKGEIVDGFKLSDSQNIISSSYAESLQDMVNAVKIYNDNGKMVGEVKDQSNINKFGLFADVYEIEDGIDKVRAAKKLLEGVSKTINLSAVGNVKCIAGYGVKVKDTLTNLTGVFWIDSDTHSWSDGVHTMSLNLTLKNLMEEVEDE